jgi:hypothetical protein
MNDEIDNMEQPGVMTVMKYDDIPPECKQDIISVWLMYTEKVKSDGSFDKHKCRIVTLSQYRDPSTIGTTFAPTVNPLSLMTQIQEAATSERIWIASYDIRHAFLMTKIKPPKRYFIKVNPDIVKYWIAFYPSRAQYIHHDGCLYYELQVYLYGLQEAPHHFNKMLDEDLRSIGFIPTTGDKCMYYKFEGSEWIKISTHVDDQFITGNNSRMKSWLETELKKKYEFTVQEEKDGISHLGMSIVRYSDGIFVNQTGYVKSIIKKYRESDNIKYPTTPATQDILDQHPSAPEVEKKQYLSLIMSLLYLARFTRPDILFPTTYLASRSSAPTIIDYQHGQHILNYLAGTIEVGIHYRKNASMIPTIYADSSHLTHHDGRGHGGIIINLGSGPIFTKSFKLKLATRSSAESELVSLEEAVSYALYYRKFLSELRLFDMASSMTIYQDNLSTIHIAENGASFQRTRHLLGRDMVVKQHVDSGEIVLKYKRSEDMIADMQTKALAKPELNHQCRLMDVGNPK